MAIAGSALLAWWRQERIVYQPPRLGGRAHPAGEEGGGGVAEVDYAAADGQRLRGFLIGASDARGVLLCFHGNAEVAAWQLPWALAVARRTGWRVLLAEYRGYAGLGGTPTYAGVALDAAAAVRLALEQVGGERGRLALFGHSLGSAVAAEAAAGLAEQGHSNPHALLLQAPFTSAREMARFVVLPPVLLAWRFISRVHYDTRARVAALDVPVWVAHGDRDPVVPVRMGRAVFAAARRPGSLLVIAGAGHNDLEARGGDAYWTWLERALER